MKITADPHFPHWAPLVSGHAGVKFTVLETLDHIKEEFQLFQAQYHSLKLECEKLASEKTEMHRHYIMVRAEIVKRLSAICTQIIPLLSQEHQHQVAQAVERSKHVSMAELNAIFGQQQFQHLSHHAPGFPLTPHPSGLTLGVGASLMALPGAFPFPPHLVPKDDLTHPEPLDSRDGAPNRSGSGSPVSHRSAGLRLGLPPPSSSSSSHADMDRKRGGADQSSTGRTRRVSRVKTKTRCFLALQFKIHKPTRPASFVCALNYTVNYTFKSHCLLRRYPSPARPSQNARGQSQNAPGRPQSTRAWASGALSEALHPSSWPSEPNSERTASVFSHAGRNQPISCLSDSSVSQLERRLNILVSNMFWCV
uniref:Transducin-like enhancer protein 1 n=1 Tax=Sinocyclocheilus grahami TaxID=75366 RepID=A0A672SJA7_SINGR